LARLKFPATLRKIGSHALSHTSLIEADFRECPELAQVGAYAFYTCNALRRVHFAAGLTSCGECAFQSCPTLGQLDFRPCQNRYMAQLRWQPAMEIILVPIGATAPSGRAKTGRVKPRVHSAGLR
jgi:hypothetical protein